MPFLVYYTVDRTPEEIKGLWDWASDECRGKVEHENPYAMGVLACLEYLMGETEERPQDYKGVFTLKNVLTQANKSQEIGSERNSGINKLLNTGSNELRPGNPKTAFYKNSSSWGNINKVK